jgi:hypothetical protein
MREYDFSSAHRLVRQQRGLGNDVEWIGWDTIVFYRPSDNAVYTTDGVWRNDHWAFANRVVVDSDGIWRIDARNIKRPRRTRN